MKPIVIFFGVIVSLGAWIWYYYLPSPLLVQNPYISSENIALNDEPVGEVLSDVAVSCVLSYGTFFVPQQDCDELVSYESSSSADSAAVSCKVESGTFLVSEHGCTILKSAQGSQDVMDRIDE